MSGQQGTSQDQMVDAGIDNRLQTHNIAETLKSLKECSLFWDLIDGANLTDILRHTGRLYTLLAPRNDALAGHEPQDPEGFLNAHLLHGAMKRADLRICDTVRTVGREVLPVAREDANVRIGEAALTRTDVQCTNGVIHVVDAFIKAA